MTKIARNMNHSKELQQQDDYYEYPCNQYNNTYYKCWVMLEQFSEQQKWNPGNLYFQQLKIEKDLLEEQ